MRQVKRAALAAAVAALTLAAGDRAAAATILSAGLNSSCGASTCFNSQGTYAITFSASAFSGPVDISKLFLARGILGSLDSHFFSLSFLHNGHQVGTWGEWNMSTVGGDELTLFGSHLTWNPADGDLVVELDLVAADGQRLVPDGAGGWYEASDGGGSGYWPGLNTGQGSGQDSITGFVPPPPPVVEPGGDQSTPPPGGAGPVPEPAAWSLMLGGFGLAGAALRRRRTAVAA